MQGGGDSFRQAPRRPVSRALRATLGRRVREQGHAASAREGSAGFGGKNAGHEVWTHMCPVPLLSWGVPVPAGPGETLRAQRGPWSPACREGFCLLPGAPRAHPTGRAPELAGLGPGRAAPAPWRTPQALADGGPPALSGQSRLPESRDDARDCVFPVTHSEAAGGAGGWRGRVGGSVPGSAPQTREAAGVSASSTCGLRRVDATPRSETGSSCNVVVCGDEDGKDRRAGKRTHGVSRFSGFSCAAAS